MGGGRTAAPTKDLFLIIEEEEYSVKNDSGCQWSSSMFERIQPVDRSVCNQWKCYVVSL